MATPLEPGADLRFLTSGPWEAAGVDRWESLCERAGGLVATSMAARSLLTPAADDSATALLARSWLRVPPAGDAAVMEEMLDIMV